MRRGRRTGGFTLIELLLVIFIIVTILVLLLPALLAGRASAMRISCVNNLKQISLGLYNYETAFGVLPPGALGPPVPVRNAPAGLEFSWQTRLLPFMEQSFVHSTINQEVPVDAPDNLTARKTVIKTLRCPYDPADEKTWSYGVTNYAGNHHDVEAPIDVDNHGAFFLNSVLRFGDLEDGASTTIVVGEKRLDTGDLGWMAGSRATLRNTGHPIEAPAAGRRLGSKRPESLVPAPASDLQVGGFGSLHTGGANFAFGDGSVRFLRSNIDPRLFRLLGNRADGEVVDDDAF